ncbi:MAG TPA: hypothetical protein VHO69_02695 [Phototrophicaceae bacterium]|nr:hypothetical protein [Phototrophicaceae bacterium]
MLQSYTLAHGEQQNNLLSDYSQATSATTSAANAIPVRGYYDSTRTPTLTWNPVSWAAWYEIQVALSAEFLPGDFVYTKVKIPAGTLSMTLDSLDNGVYYWRVRAIRADRMVSAWSAVESFMVDVP